jgi:hypothetical protein
MRCRQPGRSWVLAALASLFIAMTSCWAQAHQRVRVQSDVRLAPYTDALRTVCSFAVTEAEALGLELPETITIHAKWKAEFPSFCLARGNEIHFQACSDSDLGPYFVADPWHIRFYKIRDLLAAVLNIATGRRYPAIADMIAATDLIPKLYERHGPNAWTRPYDYNGIEGFDSYVKELWASDLLEKCPDLDLAMVAQLVVEEHGIEALCSALGTACARELDKGEEIPALAEALVEATGDNSFRERLAYTMELHQVELPEDGKLVIYDFEDAADGDLWHWWHSNAELVADAPTGTGGAIRWVKTGGDDSWPALLHQVPYWRYRDWTGFTALELDAYNASNSPQKLLVQAFDGPRRVYSVVQSNSDLPPQASAHIVLPLRQLTPQAASEGGELFDGTFHFEDVEGIALVLWPNEGPATICIDNVMLATRDLP